MKGTIFGLILLGVIVFFLFKWQADNTPKKGNVVYFRNGIVGLDTDGNNIPDVIISQLSFEELYTIKSADTLFDIPVEYLEENNPGKKIVKFNFFRAVKTKDEITDEDKKEMYRYSWRR